MNELETLLHAGYRYAVALTGNEGDAEDLLQDAWLGMIRIDGPRTKPYLFRSIKNRYIDGHRRRQVPTSSANRMRPTARSPICCCCSPRRPSPC